MGKKIPRNLVKATIMARETSAIQISFQKEMENYLKVCQKRNLKPKHKWLEFLQYLAEGKDIMSTLDALQIPADSVAFLELLEALKAHGFPEFFIDGLIREVPLDILSGPRKDRFRHELQIESEYL
jgi:hypothetical protein